MIPSSRCPTPEECDEDGCAGQCADMKTATAEAVAVAKRHGATVHPRVAAIKAKADWLANVLRDLEAMSPIQSVVVISAAGFQEAVSSMALKGMRLACQSNTGLSAGSWRLTFLPDSAFTNEPQPAGRVTAAQVDGDLEPRGPTKSGVEPLNVGDEHALAAWIARCQDGPPRCRQAPINLKDLVKSL